MRISINKEPLLAAIQSVIGVITTKNTLPILSNILIETSKTDVKLTATDLDIGMVVTTPADIVEEGSITIPAKRLIDIVKELPEKQVEVYTKKNNTVVIESEGILFKILGIPKDEFPKLPTLEKEEELVLKQCNLKRMIEMTSFAMSHDETRYVLNGICLVISKKFIRMVATDGRRLTIVTEQNETGFKEEKTAIIPTKTIQELTRSLEGDENVQIGFSKNQAMFQLGELFIISRLIEGEFPNYEQAIPKKSDNKVKVKKEELVAAVKRANLLTTPESQAIKLQLAKNKLVVSKTTPEIGEAREDLAAEYSGEDLLIGFNPAYLLDVLKCIKEEDVAIELTGPEKPAVIRIKDSYIYIVLPMQIT